VILLPTSLSQGCITFLRLQCFDLGETAVYSLKSYVQTKEDFCKVQLFLFQQSLSNHSLETVDSRSVLALNLQSWYT